MKSISTKFVKSAAAVAAASLLPLSGFGQTVIGSWQDTNGDGWIDWSGGQAPISTLPAKYSYQSGAVSGYPQSLKITQTGWNQGLSIKLQDNGYVDDFLNNHLLTFTFSVPSSADSGSTAGFSQLNAFILNSPAGFNGIDWSSGLWSYSGDTGANQSGMPNFYFWDGSPAHSQTVTLDYSSLLPAMGSNPGWVELIFTSNNGGGAPSYFFMNEVVLSSAVVPEPSTLALVGLGTAALWFVRRRDA